MSYKAYAILFCILQFININYAQTTFFLKYKSSVPQTVIDDKILTKQFFVNTDSRILNKSSVNVSYFAKKLGKKNESLSRIVKVEFTDSASGNNFYQLALKDPTVEYVEPSHLYKIDSVPNDSLVSQQWALQKIKAFDAWKITQGSDSIIIGLIDTGVDYLHPDLKNKIYFNYGEVGTDNYGKNKETNGIDDDGNGFIDDYMGWDFTDRTGFPFDSTTGDYTGWDNNPMDENGHGTYIAGIIAAETNNKIGIAGTAPKVRILNIRAFDPSGYGEEDDVSAAILYAVKMGAKVINMSFGDSQFSYVLKDVIKYAYDKGVVLVASSGNDGSNEPHYPSGYSEVICVGNSTQNDNVASSSNFGSTLDLVAPGTDILTTAMGGGYSTVSGTSASAPFVSAAAGLVLSIGSFSNEEVKQILKSTADNIGNVTWNIYSGAGRLNIFRALNVLAPSVIKFNSPLQDYATSSDTLSVNATVLSAYFENYCLYYGVGLNPLTWIPLIENGQYQFSDKNIFNLNTSSLKDTVYCLRLVVNKTTGLSSEERVNFYIQRSPPQTNVIYVQNAFYGNLATIMASVSSNQLTRVRMFFRKTGTLSFNFITLDDFGINNQIVKYDHYGFIPTNLLEQNSSYEIYFESENLVGLKTEVKNGNSYFTFNTNFNFSSSNEKVQPYTLPAGYIYKSPVNLTSPDSDEIFLRPLTSPSTTYLYKFQNNSFVQEDSFKNKIVKDFGDFNHNGSKDLLAYYVYNSFIYEQNEPNSQNFIQKFASDTTKKFWPVFVKDLYGDGSKELMELDSDTSFVIWNINSDLSLSSPLRFFNYTVDGPGNNFLDAPHAVVADIDGSGKNEIWMIDTDGDIFSYLINGIGNFQKWKTIQTGLYGSTALLTYGDYLGDGRKELAVLLSSPSNANTTSFYKLIIFRFDADTLNLIYNKIFVNPASESTNGFNHAYNSIRFSDIDNDGKDELVLFAFPYSYIFKYENGQNKIVSYKTNINSNTIFIGDLNKDGIPEVAFPTNEGISFSEFSSSISSSIPVNLSGYSIDSSSVNLSWTCGENKYYIFKGTNNQKLFLIDSTEGTSYIDKNVKKDSTYFYAVKSFNSNNKIKLSNLSEKIQVFVHNPAKLKSVVNNTPNSLIVNFSDRINTKIENLEAFNVTNVGFPNSIAAYNQFSYLLSFNKPFETGNHQLIFSNLKDYYDAPMPSDSAYFTITASELRKEFYISSCEVVSPYYVKLTFNYDVDTISIFNKSNFVFTPENQITDISVDNSDHNIIYINLKGAKPVGAVGIEYSLKINNIFSSEESGHIPINKDAGSYVILSINAENLSKVYVYPSPVKIENGNGKITFANLPQQTKITIFNLSGKKINKIESSNRSGGVDFILRDSKGDLLSSGVYIYRIVRLDSNNHEVEEKIGKFAVIK
jgi:hypothetical protein